MEIFVVIGLLVVIVGLYFGSNYKELNEQRAGVEDARKKLDEQLKHRHQSITDIGETLHGKHEPLWTRVTSARAAADNATNSDTTARASAEKDLSEALGAYFAELQKDASMAENDEFTKLRDRILEVEDSVNLARSDFNTAAARYNMRQHVFPNTIFAKNLGLKPVPEMEFEGAFERYPLKFKGTMPEKRPPLYLQQADSKKKKQETQQ
jgi:LemA protein